MAIYRYVLVDRDGAEHDHEHDTLTEARDTNRIYNRGECAIIERTYEFDDSELVSTPDGSNSWPPDESRWRR